MSWLDRFARRAVAARLGALREGRLLLRDNGSTRAFGNGSGPAARVRVHDARFYRDLALGGHVGAAEAFMDGHWDCDDLSALVRILVRNHDVLDSLEKGVARLAHPMRRVRHALRRNTRNGSRKNIAAHYDLGDEFFALFLDDTLTYSCAYFERPDATLRDASVAKYERLCEKAGLAPGHEVAEIGSGWGGFALHAARDRRARVTTTTISRKQYEHARARARTAGLRGRVQVLNRDYRLLEGRFDAVVSIEMIEAVGHHFYDTFFGKCASLLKPGGRLALQAITIRDEHYEAARREIDFIKRHIFPGSCIPSPSVLTAAAERAGFRVREAEDLTPHYVETLKRWRRNFARNRDRILALGFSEEFCRMWEFYFCYCEGGFAERYTGVRQMAFEKR